METDAVTRRSVPAAARFGHWTAPDGHIIRRLDWLPEGDGKGILLFAGGRGDFIEKYLEAQAHFWRRGWHVVAVDWRGQGGSQGAIRNGHLDDFAPLTRDFAALVAELGRDGRPVAALGHSMGGHLVLRSLVEHRPALRRVALTAPMIAVNAGPIPDWLGLGLASAASALGLSERPLHSRAFGAAPPGSLRQRILTACPERYADELWWWEQQPEYALGPPSWGWLRAAYRSSRTYLAPERLRIVTTPILMLGTDADRLVSPAAIRAAAASLPFADLHMYPDAGHELLREADAVRLDALGRIATFLEE